MKDVLQGYRAPCQHRLLLCLQEAEDMDTGEYYEVTPEVAAPPTANTAESKGKSKIGKKVQYQLSTLPTALASAGLRLGSIVQEAEEEDSEAARIAQLKGMSKLIHKMSNSISARRPQCFGGQPGMAGPTDGKQVQLGNPSSAYHHGLQCACVLPI